MPERELLLDKAIPDLLPTANLSPELAAEVHYLAGTTAASTAGSSELSLGLTARQHFLAGALGEARSALERSVELQWTKQGLAAAIWTASRVGSPEVLERLSAELGVFDAGFVVDGDVPLGARSMFEGLLLAATGQLSGANERLSEAARMGDERAPVWGALARVELGRVRSTLADLAGGEAVRQDARRSLLTAQTFFAAGGFVHLATVARALMSPAAPVDAAVPGLGHLRLEQTWWAGFGVEPPRSVRKGKGLLALQYLIKHNGRRVPAVEIERVLNGESPTPLDQALIEQLMESQFADSGYADEVRRQLFDDRARSRVSKLLSRTMQRLSGEHRLLGEHLLDSIETGFACRYNPQTPIIWRL